MTDEAPLPLFSYGTLQQENVQRATFGRLLEGVPDVLAGYRLKPVTITSAEVVATGGAETHTIAYPTGDPDDHIMGTLFHLTRTELAAADAYETEAYRRIEVMLGSGVRAYVYRDAW